jgi:hypothetical protein
MAHLDFVLAGCIGALFPELVRIGKGPVQGVFSTPGYWIQLASQILLGALAAYFLGPTSIKEAITLGFTAPQIVTRVAAAPTPTPPVTPPAGGGGPATFSTQIWWSR